MVHFNPFEFVGFPSFIKESLKGLSIVEILTFGIFLASVALIFVLFLVKGYRKIRNSIPAKVNCWFCNEDANVPYVTREGWTCPSCKQYNGFNEDGGYNKRIPAQFIAALNRPVFGAKGKGGGNGESQNPGMKLCDGCNWNLELKYFQLAQYVPAKEDRYDEEIEAEQRRLDKVYDICDPCKAIVKKALEGKRSRSTTPTAATTPKRIVLPIVERPPRTSTPVPMPRQPLRRDQTATARQTPRPLEGLPREDGDLFGSKLNQLHISNSYNQQQPSMPSSIFGGSNSSRFVNTGSPSSSAIDRRFDLHPSLSKPMTSLSSYSYSLHSLPLSLVSGSGYLDDKRGLGADFYKSWQNNQQPLYSSYNNSLNTSNNTNRNQYISRSPSYRSSSVASVFGGSKPLLSPSRLSSSLNSRRQQEQDIAARLSPCPAAISHYNNICYCHPQNGLSAYGASATYGVVYGNPNLSLPTSPNAFISSPGEEQYNISSYMHPLQPRSKSSSQSSGFVSVSPTPTPPSRFSSTPNSGSQDGEEPLQHSTSAFMSPSRSRSHQELRRRGHFTSSQSQSSAAASPTPSHHSHYSNFSSQQRQSSYRTRSLSRRIRLTKQFKQDSDLVFSDDDVDNDEVGPSRNTRIDQWNPNKETIFSRLFKYVGNYIGAALSLKNLLQIFLRTFLFINVLLVFCIMFVGKWPEPMQTVINTGFDFYEKLFDYLFPLVLLFESGVNKVLSFIIPSADEIVDDESVQRVLFEGFA